MAPLWGVWRNNLIYQSIKVMMDTSKFMYLNNNQSGSHALAMAFHCAVLVVRAIALHGRYEFFLFLISRLDPEWQPGTINYLKNQLKFI